VAAESEFDNRVVLVTGAAGGIGTAVARRFLAAGAQVFAVDLQADRLAAAVAELSASPGTAVYPIEADVTVVTDCERMVRVAVAGGGRLDVLVNCAGLWVEGPSETMTEADWDRVVDVNLKGTFFCCRYAIPELRKTQGCIVNVSSEAGVVGTPETAVYTASKGGVNLLTKSLALELAPDLVRVNAVCPGDVQTPMLQYQADTFGGGDPEGYLRRLLGCYAQGGRARFIRPDEVAELVCYLAAEKAAPITGALLSIDFGSSAGYTYR
jgi:NAD(P)-dependent dehydrogenase (short-subunit alcohol dehydrogenase family)